MCRDPPPPPTFGHRHAHLPAALHSHMFTCTHLNVHSSRCCFTSACSSSDALPTNRRKRLRLSSGAARHIRLASRRRSLGVRCWVQHSRRNQGDLRRRGAAAPYTTNRERQGANTAGNHGGAPCFRSRFTALSGRFQRGSKGTEVLN